MDEESSRPRKPLGKSPGKHAQKPRRAPRPAGPAPGEAALREAALAHLARFAATEIGLKRVLQRRVDRWARRAESEGALPEVVAPQAAAARAAAAVVAKAMVAAGAVDDAAFAASRARRLARGGRSRRAIAAHLGAKGVAAETAAAALPAAETELDAAALRQRRLRPGGGGGGAGYGPGGGGGAADRAQKWMRRGKGRQGYTNRPGSMIHSSPSQASQARTIRAAHHSQTAARNAIPTPGAAMGASIPSSPNQKVRTA